MEDRHAPPVRLMPLVSAIGEGKFCTVVLVDLNRRPMMNLHKVPQHVSILDIKRKISERFKDVGRSLAVDTMILNYGESLDEEMENGRRLSTYNTMGLSRVTVLIKKRTKFIICVIAVTAENKCLCLKRGERQELSFEVCVPSSCRVKHLRMEVVRRMNCNIGVEELGIFFDPNLQERMVVEGTIREQGIGHCSTVYIKAPPDLDLEDLAPFFIGRAKEDGMKNHEAPSANATRTEGVLSETTDAEEDKTEGKSALQVEFDQRAGKSLTLSREQAANFARKLGYSPSNAELAELPEQVDYKAFQNFLQEALHAGDLAETFQQFFALFDTQATGDISSKQLCNIVQMCGDDPLTKQEAESFTRLIMESHNVLPIKIIVDRIMEGQV